MSIFHIVTPYSQAMWKLALTQKVTDTVYLDMCFMNEICHSHKVFIEILKNPLMGHVQKYYILNKIFKNKVHSITLSLFRVTTKRNRAILLPAIFKAFICQYYKYKGIQKAHVDLLPVR